MFADSGGDTVAPERTKDHPRFERPEPPSELQPVVHIVDLAGPGVPGQILRRQREDGAQQIGAPHEQRAEVERNEHPLVRVDHDGVRELDAVHRPLPFRHERHRSTVRRVHVQPDAALPTHRRNLAYGIDARRGRRADRGDDGHRPKPGADVIFDRTAQRRDVQAKRFVARDADHVRFPEPEHDHRLVDRAVRLVRRIDPVSGHIGPAGHTVFAHVDAAGLARRRPGHEEWRWTPCRRPRR